MASEIINFFLSISKYIYTKQQEKLSLDHKTSINV
jgi:hypothetical protein